MNHDQKMRLKSESQNEVAAFIWGVMFGISIMAMIVIANSILGIYVIK